MKQKRIKSFSLSTLCLLAVVGSNFVSAENKNVSENVEKTKTSEVFFYNKGYRDGVSDGEKIGFNKAMQEATKYLQGYSKKIKSMEVSKYLYLKGKITPPRLYQVLNKDNTLRVVVEGCKIEKQLTPKEILLLPMLTRGEMEANGYSQKGDTLGNEKNSISNAVFLSGIDKKQKKPHFKNKAKKQTYRYFPDTNFYREIFRNSNKPFSINTNNRIKVLFKSEKEAMQFAKDNNFVAGRDFQ